MTAFMLKLIAIITMTLDHTSYLVYGHLSWMNFIGRIAFPIFAFQISEGFIKTHNPQNYAKRLLIFALISQLPYTWFRILFFNDVELNIIFTLILGLASIIIYNTFSTPKKDISKSIALSYKLIGLMCVLIIALCSQKFNFDYGFYGVFIIFLFYVFHNKKLFMNLSVIALTFIFYLPNLIATNFHYKVILLFLCSLIPLIFINLYNGKKGKNYKWLFYIFYPVHLLILCLLYYIIH